MTVDLHRLRIDRSGEDAARYFGDRLHNLGIPAACSVCHRNSVPGWKVA